MNEAIRSYSAGKGHPLLLRARGRGRRALILVAGTIFLFAVYGLWVSRDTHALGEFIEQGQELELHFERPLDRRLHIADSSLWNAFPDDHVARSIPKLLQNDWGMREWILRNVIGAEAYLFAKSLNDGEDFLFLTRMSHVGTVTERFYRRLPPVQNEKAGGLGLRKLRDENLYYAVRGRILLASPSRNSLIRALTLEKGDRAEQWHRPKNTDKAGREDVSGVIRFTGSSEFSAAVKSIGFALHFDSDVCAGRFRTVLVDESQENFSALFENSRPGKLRAPYPGALQISADFGVPVRELFSTLGDGFDFPGFSGGQWEAWEQGAHGTIGPVLTNLTGDAGSHVCMTWRGMDLNEMVPTPELAFLFDVQRGDISERLSQLPSPPQSSAMDEGLAYYDPEAMRAEFPLSDGSGVTPVVALVDDRLLLSSSGALADVLEEEAGPEEMAADHANLFIAIRPRAVGELLQDAGRVLAENDLLRDNTSESFERASAEWMGRAAVLDEIKAWVALRDGSLEGEFTIAYNSGPR